MTDDPVLARRRQFERIGDLGRRIGWLFVLGSVVAFGLALAFGFDPWGTVVIAALVAATVTLAPAIVLGYAVKAAEREDPKRRDRQPGD